MSQQTNRNENPQVMARIPRSHNRVLRQRWESLQSRTERRNTLQVPMTLCFTLDSLYGDVGTGFLGTVHFYKALTLLPAY